jgi:hypothetical protein
MFIARHVIGMALSWRALIYCMAFELTQGYVRATAAENEPPDHKAMKINGASKKIIRVASKEQ